MTTLPDCDRCDANNSLEPIRADGPLIWCQCKCCAKTCLVKDGVIVHHGS